MAEAKKSTKSAIIKRLTPDSVEVNINGRDIRVASSKGENTTLNAIVVAQGRDLIQRSIKAYEDADEVPSARELLYILQAMQSMVATSDVVYPNQDQVLTRGEKAVESAEPEVDFHDLHKPPEIVPDGNPGNPPKVNGS